MGCTYKSFAILCRLSSIPISVFLSVIHSSCDLTVNYSLFGFSLFWFSPSVAATLIFVGSLLTFCFSRPWSSSSLSTNFVCRRLLNLLYPSVSSSSFNPSLSSPSFFLQASSALSLHLPANHPLSLKIYKKPSECIIAVWVFASSSSPSSLPL